MVTESIFHNFVVNDAEGAERIAEVLDASMSETTKGGFATLKKDGIDFTYVSDPEELRELVEKWKKNVVHFTPSEGESTTFTPLDISGENELCFDRHYSYTPPIFLLKSPNKTSTKRLEINLELPMKEEEEVEERIISPLEEAWRWTQDKKSKFHKEYLSTYYSLTPCLEEIAEALSAWTEQYLECTSEEEREKMENELSQALSKNGSIRKVKHYIMLQMNAIKIKEEQYQEDVREAERSLADVTPAAPAPTPRKDVFAGIENFASSLNEMDALIHKYNEPKKKGKKKK